MKDDKIVYLLLTNGFTPFEYKSYFSINTIKKFTVENDCRRAIEIIDESLRLYKAFHEYPGAFIFYKDGLAAIQKQLADKTLELDNLTKKLDNLYEFCIGINKK